MATRSKRYQAAKALIEDRLYDPADALSLVKQAQSTKFNESVELHLKLSINSKKQDQQIRTTVTLPNGTGKRVSVLVFAEGEFVQVAKDAGADYVSDDELISKIEKGWTEFDVALASQEMMPKIGKLGRLLGRKGLMPSPRSGTVVKAENLKTAIEEIKKGRIELRSDQTGCVHATIGTIEFTEQKLLENLLVLFTNLLQATPESFKGALVKSAALCSTMGPSIKIDFQKLQDLDTQN